MPMKWDRSRKSPYVCNHFGVLRVGPNTRRAEITATETKLRQELDAGKVVCCACGHEVDVHQVGKAKAQLLDPRSYAEELLLVHPQPPKDDKKQIRALVETLCQQASLPPCRHPIPLRHPGAVFWFTPAPEDNAVPIPSWDDLGLPRAGSPLDLALDIVFDR
jgi:hypothetical protein